MIMARTGIILCMRMATAILSNENITEALGWSRDELIIRQGGPLDLRIGRIANCSGFLYGARFYVPDVTTVSKVALDEDKKIKFERSYGSDSATEGGGKEDPSASEEDRKVALYRERFYRTMVYMFPSAGGLLNISTGAKDSLYKVLKSHDRKLSGRKSPQILAALMAMALGARLEKSFISSDDPNSKDGTTCGSNVLYIKHGDVIDASIKIKKRVKVQHIVQFFRGGAEFDHNNPNTGTFLLSKELLIHAFVHYFLSDIQELNMFINTFYELVKDDKQLCRKCFARSDELYGVDKSAEAEIYEKIMNPNLLGIVRTLPFTPSSPQLPFGEAYFYKQVGERFLPDAAIFSDCVEVALLSALYCLFFDPSSQKCKLNESCERLMRSKLPSFFDNYPEPDKVSKRIQDDWLRIVEDLDDDQIMYCKTNKEENCRGELCTGFINLLRVIVKIVGLDAAEYLSEFIVYRKQPTEEEQMRIIAAFQRSFTKAISRLSSKSVRIIYPRGLKMERVGYDANWDLTGSIEFEMDDKVSGNVGIFRMIQEAMHTKLEVKKAFADVGIQKLDDLKQRSGRLRRQPRNLLSTLIEYAVEYLINNVNQNEPEIRQSIGNFIEKGSYLPLVSTVPLQGDAQRITVLMAIFASIIPSGNFQVTQLAENILNNLVLGEDCISSVVHPLVAFNTHFRNKYAAILEKHTMEPGRASLMQRAWVDYTNDIQDQCLRHFYNQPELFMYLDEFSIANIIVSTEDMDDLVYHAVRNLPDEDMKQKVYACGLLYASKFNDLGPARYCFESLKITDDSIIKQARHIYLEHMGEESEKVDFLMRLFLDEAQKTDDPVTIKKIYSWCCSPDAISLYTRELLPLIKATYGKVGIEFVFDKIMNVQDVRWILLHYDGYVYFYTELLAWLYREGLPLRQDISALIWNFIEAVESECQDEGSQYFGYDSTAEKEERNAKLSALLRTVPLDTSPIASAQVCRGRQR